MTMKIMVAKRHNQLFNHITGVHLMILSLQTQENNVHSDILTCYRTE